MTQTRHQPRTFSPGVYSLPRTDRSEQLSTDMHDWSLNTLVVDWKEGAVTLDLKGPHRPATLIAQNFRELRVPRTLSWGPSISLNRVTGPAPTTTGAQRMAIEVQS